MARKLKAIEMSGDLPRFPHDDVEWICRNLQPIAPQSVSGFMRRMGLTLRSLTGGPSPTYHRIAAAFVRGKDEGRIAKSVGRNWYVPDANAKAS